LRAGDRIKTQARGGLPDSFEKGAAYSDAKPHPYTIRTEDALAVRFSAALGEDGEWNDPRISVMNADGTGQRTLDVRGASQPAWSPDGDRIAFTSDSGPDKATWDNEEIFSMNPDGSARKRLTDISGNDHWPPTWSPDGTAQMGEIYAMNSDGSGLTRLTYARAYDAFPARRP
jgi:TolB protein